MPADWKKKLFCVQLTIDNKNFACWPTSQFSNSTKRRKFRLALSVFQRKTDNSTLEGEPRRRFRFYNRKQNQVFEKDWKTIKSHDARRHDCGLKLCPNAAATLLHSGFVHVKCEREIRDINACRSIARGASIDFRASYEFIQLKKHFYIFAQQTVLWGRSGRMFQRILIVVDITAATLIGLIYDYPQQSNENEIVSASHISGGQLSCNFAHSFVAESPLYVNMLRPTTRFHVSHPILFLSSFLLLVAFLLVHR